MFPKIKNRVKHQMRDIIHHFIQWKVEMSRYQNFRKSSSNVRFAFISVLSAQLYGVAMVSSILSYMSK